MYISCIIYSTQVYFGRIFLYKGLKDLDSSLGAYPYDTLKKWVSLSNFVSKDLASRFADPTRCVSFFASKLYYCPCLGVTDGVMLTQASTSEW